MRYLVTGVSRTTGRETTLVVNAKHHEAAEAIAQQHLIVSSVTPEGGLSEPEPFDPRSLDPKPEILPTFPSTPTPSFPKPRRPRRVPTFIISLVLAILLIALFVFVVMRRM